MSQGQLTSSSLVRSKKAIVIDLPECGDSVVVKLFIFV